ncbi:voltage-gated purine nucleotide uniporter SLC17A9 isoform 4-T4 [Glossophaga mutica]
MQPMRPPPDQARGDAAEDAQWSRPECQAWTGALLLGTCLLYCSRVSGPICAVAMSRDFGWDKKEAGVVLSSFFWGYCLTQIAGGHLGDRIGGEKVILLSASAWGLITAATPLLAHLGSAHLVFMTFSRILTGLLQEGPGERARLHLQRRGGRLPGRDAGDGGGGLPAPGLVRLAERLLPLRRPHPAVGVLRVQVPAERTRRPLPGLGRLGAGPADAQAPQGPLETALPEGFCLGWVFNVVPWLVAVPASLCSGLLSDHLISQGYRTIAVRKFMQVMGLGLSSVFAVCLGHTSSFCKSVLFASASIGLQTFNHSGISVNIQDLAPSCAGVLFGVANTAGALAGERRAGVPCPRCCGASHRPLHLQGVVGVGLGGYLIETTGSWTSLFHLVAAISSLGLCGFLMFGKAQRVDLGPTHEDL